MSKETHAQPVIEYDVLQKKLSLTQQLVSGLVALITAFCVAYAYFYTIQDNVKDNTEKLKSIETGLDDMKNKIQDNEVYKGVSETQVKSLEEKVNRIENKMDKMDEKLDKILIRK